MKRSPLKRRSPLKAKTPLKRGAGIKRKSRPRRSKAEQEHFDRVGEMDCIACGRAGPSTIHHVSSDRFKRIARSDRLVVPLCPQCHFVQWGPKTSIEAIGHGAFCERVGVDLLAEALRLWGDTEKRLCGKP